MSLGSGLGSPEAFGGPPHLPQLHESVGEGGGGGLAPLALAGGGQHGDVLVQDGAVAAILGRRGS